MEYNLICVFTKVFVVDLCKMNPFPVHWPLVRNPQKALILDFYGSSFFYLSPQVLDGRDHTHVCQKSYFHMSLDCGLLDFSTQDAKAMQTRHMSACFNKKGSNLYLCLQKLPQHVYDVLSFVQGPGFLGKALEALDVLDLDYVLVL